MAKKLYNAIAGSRRRAWTFFGVLGSAFLIAVVTAIGTGLGSQVLDPFGGETKLVTGDDREVFDECRSRFVNAPQARRILSGEIPLGTSWAAFWRSTGGVVVRTSEADVSIQGETARTITLTRIDFIVDHRRKPQGAIFSSPGCGDAAIGRFLVVDLDRQPVAVIDSNKDPNAGRRCCVKYKPFRFPWSVSVTDSLLLTIIARTKRCYCIWRAEITWRSGGQSGVIRVDNHGKGYAVAGSDDTESYGWTNTGWTAYGG
jgi:hypothetical protein